MGFGGGTEVARLYGTLGLQDNFTNAVQTTLSNTEALFSNSARGIQNSGNSLASGIATTMAVTAEGIRTAARGIGAVLDSMPMQIAGAAVDMAIEWESAFAGVIKTVDATDEELAELEAGLRSLATADVATAGLEDAHVTLAGIAEAAGQLGVANEDILSFTETMANLGVATNLTGEEAATMLAQFANITGMDMGDIDRLGSTIVALGNSMATTERDIVNMAQRLSGIGGAVGMSESEIMALSGTMSSLGLAAEAGGTAMTTILNDMSTAVAEGGDALSTFAGIADQTADEFAQSFQDQPVQALRDFVAGLGELSAAEQANVLNELDLSGIRVADTLRRMSSDVGLFDTALETANSAWEDNIALTQEAEARYNTTESQMNRFNNRLNDLGVTIGNALLPVFNNLLDIGGGVVEIVAGIIGGDTAAFESGWNSVAGAIESILGIELPDFAATFESWRQAGERLGQIFFLLGERIAVALSNAKLQVEELLLNLAFALVQADVLGGGADREETAQFHSAVGRLQARRGVVESAQELAMQLRQAMATQDFTNIEIRDFSVQLPEIVDGELTGNVTEQLYNLIEMAAQGVTITPETMAAIPQSIRNSIVEAMSMAAEVGDVEAVQMLMPIAIQMDQETAVASLNAEIQTLAASENVDAFHAVVTTMVEADLLEGEALQFWNEIYAEMSQNAFTFTEAVDVVLSARSVDASAVFSRVQSVVQSVVNSISPVVQQVQGAFDFLPQFQEGGYVPHDMVARLHGGEYVLTAAEYRAYRDLIGEGAQSAPLMPDSGGQGGGQQVFNVNYLGTAYDLIDNLDRARRKLAPAT